MRADESEQQTQNDSSEATFFSLDANGIKGYI